MTSPRPLVTIAIPTYNRADGYLSEALDSALAQTYTPLEILVSDNCSTDGTADLVRSYDDPRIRYIQHETNLGAQGNHNFCVDAARGAFFLFLHDDDRIAPDFVDTCIGALDRFENVGYVRTGLWVLNGEGHVTEDRPNGAVGTSGVSAVLAWTRGKNYWSLSSTLFETAAVRRMGGLATDDFPLSFDAHATARIGLREGGVELEPPKAYFRVHPDELTFRVPPSEWIDELQRLHRAILSWVPTKESRTALRTQGNAFFSELCYRHAENIDGRLARLAVHASIAFHFGHLSPSMMHRLHAWRVWLSPSEGEARTAT